MDREEILSMALAFARTHWLPLLFACLSLCFFGIGVIALLGSSQSQDDILFSSIDSEEFEEKKDAMLVVDVAGSVVHPGVYRLTFDARVQDALVAAGGLSETANREVVAKRINLASKVTDGMKISIPSLGEPATATILGAQNSLSEQSNVEFGADQQVSINTASTKQLENLPSIGPATAEKIINACPFGSLEEVVQKKAVTQKTFDKIKDRLVL